jgi:ABC-2 type transport system permease protein
MMRSLYLKTLYQKRWIAFWWFIGLMLMVLLTLLFFPAFKNSDLGQTFSTLPPALQKVAGDMTSFMTIGGYISQQIFALRMPMLTIILSIVLFVSLTVGDEKKGILETQLSLPLSRSKILAQKLLVALTILGVASLGIFVGVVLGLLLIRENYSVMTIAMETLGCFLVSLCFGMIAFLFGAGTGGRALTVGVASVVAFVSYLISSLAVALPELQSVDKFSLFHYFAKPAEFGLGEAILFAVIAIWLGIAAFVLFERRDIKSQ